MKTLKIDEVTHWELTKLISDIYEKTNQKLTYSEVINQLYIHWERTNDK